MMDEPIADPSLPSPGQYNLPSHGEIVRQFEGIFDRQYYTESGPLVRTLEDALRSRLGASQVVCTCNPTVAWIMLLEAGLTLRRIVAPATMPKSFAEAVRWTRSEWMICDVEALRNYQLTRGDVEAVRNDAADGIVAINAWGGAADVEDLVALAHERNAKLFFDSSQSLGSMIGERPIGAFGNAEVFALTPENIVNGAGGACICTNDELLADRMRCMRSSSGVRRQVLVSKTVNGRMSEAQAAYALLGLESLDDNIGRNRSLYDIYARHLKDVPGLTLHASAGVSFSNHQQAVLTVHRQQYGEGAAELVQRLGDNSVSARRLEFPLAPDSVDTSSTLPGFRSLVETGLELPLGSATDTHAIESICRILLGFRR